MHEQLDFSSVVLEMEEEGRNRDMQTGSDECPQNSQSRPKSRHPQNIHQRTLQSRPYPVLCTFLPPAKLLIWQGSEFSTTQDILKIPASKRYKADQIRTSSKLLPVIVTKQMQGGPKWTIVTSRGHPRFAGLSLSSAGSFFDLMAWFSL